MFARLNTLPWLPIVIVGMTLLRLVASVNLGLVPDEAYYWLWAQHPALGYYDHPPMVAWWIAAIGHLGDYFPRLLFVLSFLAMSWLIWDAGKVLFGEAVARRAVLWLNACLLLSVGSVLATPDPPSVLMWTGGLWALARLLSGGKGWWWLVFGLFAGLGVEAKYTNLFLGLGVVAWMIADKPARKWLLTPWPYLGAIVALAAMAPNLFWNAQNDWVTVAKQFGRVGADEFTLKFLLEFLISQPLLLNPLIFAFVYIGAFAAFQTQDSRLRLLVALPLPLLAYLLLHVFHDRIQGNWTAPIFPGLVLLGAVMAEGIQGGILLRARWLAAPLGIGLSAVVLSLVCLHLLPASVEGMSEGWRPLSNELNDISMREELWVATTDYNTHAQLSYVTSVAPNAMGLFMPYAVAERQRYPWQDASWTQTAPALIVIASDKAIDPAKCFTDLTDLGTISRTKKPSPKSTFRLFRGTLISPDCDLKK